MQELIVNGGFENGPTSWFVNNGNGADGGTLRHDDGRLLGIERRLVTGRTTTGSGPMQDLSGKVQAGQTYALKARIKYENANGPATKQFFATMHYGGGTYTNLVSVTATQGPVGALQRHVHHPGRAERGDRPPLLRDAVDPDAVDGARHAPDGLQARRRAR